MHAFMLTISTIISILSLIIIYQLFYYLCYCLQIVQPKPQISNLPSLSTSASASNSITKKNSSPKRNRSGTDDMHWFFRYTTIITCLLFLAVCICVNITNILLTANGELQNKQKIFLSYGIFPCYFIGRILLSLIFIGTLYLTFLGTPFAYTKGLFYCLGCMWFFMLFCVIVSLFLGPYAIFRMISIALGSFFILMDIVVSCILLYLYLKKLFLLMVAG
eukprot:319495_1